MSRVTESLQAMESQVNYDIVERARKLKEKVEVRVKIIRMTKKITFLEKGVLLEKLKDGSIGKEDEEWINDVRKKYGMEAIDFSK